MPADKRFHERIGRINAGTTWACEGVVDPRRIQRKSRRTKALGRFVLTVFLFAAAPFGMAAYGVTVPDPIIGFFTAPTTEAAMASLGRMELFAGLAR
jgi:hypothetical protein